MNLEKLGNKPIRAKSYKENTIKHDDVMSNANGKPHNSDYLLIFNVDCDFDLTIWQKSTCRKADVDGWIWKDG